MAWTMAHADRPGQAGMQSRSLFSVTNVLYDCPMTPGEAVKALRKMLNVSQADLASKTEGEIDQTYIARIESGRNKATSWKVRSGLAKGFGLALADVEELLDGRMTPQEALHRIQARGLGDIRDDGSRGPGQRESDWLNDSLRTAFLPVRHTFDDVDAVRIALRHLRRTSALAGTVDGDVARRWLDAAAYMRVNGLAITAEALLVVATNDLNSRLDLNKALVSELGGHALDVGQIDLGSGQLPWWQPSDLVAFANVTKGWDETHIRALVRLPLRPGDLQAPESKPDLGILKRMLRAAEASESRAAARSRARADEDAAAEDADADVEPETPVVLGPSQVIRLVVALQVEPAEQIAKSAHLPSTWVREAILSNPVPAYVRVSLMREVDRIELDQIDLEDIPF